MTNKYEPHPIIDTKNSQILSHEEKIDTIPAPAESPWKSWATTRFRNIPADGNDPLTGTGLFAHTSTEDIPYDLLLTRLFLQKDCSIKLNTYGSKKPRLLTPYVIPVGNKRTIIANFEEICDALGRHKDHVVQYLFTEQGTSGSFDQRGRLIMKGRFKKNGLERLLKRYNEIYVLCSNCGSNATALRKGEQRKVLVNCSSCEIEAIVPALRTGFVNKIPRRRKPVPPPREEAAPKQQDEPEVHSAPGEHCFTGIMPKPKL